MEAATRGDGAWCTAASVRFVERPSDLNFERVDLIGPATTVGGWGGAEAWTRPVVLPAEQQGGRTTGGGVALTCFLGVEK
jgi:hypothetical protein